MANDKKMSSTLNKVLLAKSSCVFAIALHAFLLNRVRSRENYEHRLEAVPLLRICIARNLHNKAYWLYG